MDTFSNIEPSGGWYYRSIEKQRAEASQLPIEYLREYDGAAEQMARTGKMPLNMSSPGAIDYIEADPEAFEDRVREYKYAAAMNKLNIAEDYNPTLNP